MKKKQNSEHDQYMYSNTPLENQENGHPGNKQQE